MYKSIWRCKFLSTYLIHILVCFNCQSVKKIPNFPYNFLFDHGLFKICCLTSKFLWIFRDKLKPAHYNKEPMCHNKDPAQLKTKFKNKNAGLKGIWLQMGSWLMFNLYWVHRFCGSTQESLFYFSSVLEVGSTHYHYHIASTACGIRTIILRRPIGSLWNCPPSSEDCKLEQYWLDMTGKAQGTKHHENEKLLCFKGHYQ